MQVMVLTFPQKRCFTENTTCPLSGMLMRAVGLGSSSFFFSPAFHGANLPKSAREILGWEFGGIDLGINLFLFGFINFQERKIPLIEPAKNTADFLNFFLLFHRQNIEMLFQIPEKLQRIFRERNSKRKRVLLILLPWMRINFESCCKFDLKSFVVMQAWKKTK